MGAHKYTLQPTPSTHPIKARPLYHEIRSEIAKLKENALADLVRLENLVLRNRGQKKADTAEPAPAEPVNMLPALRDVRDQGDQGSCFAFAGTAAQALVEGMQQSPPSPIAYDYAPAYLSFETRKLMGTQDFDSGGNLGDAITAQEAGTCVESEMPYDPAVFATPPSEPAVENAETHKPTFRAYPIDISDAGNITQALNDGCPVYFGFGVWTGFDEGVGSDGIVPPPDGSNLGGHANLLFATPGAPADTWPDQNSWGQGWGKQGRCFFPISALSTLMEAYALVPVTG